MWVAGWRGTLILLLRGGYFLGISRLQSLNSFPLYLLTLLRSSLLDMWHVQVRRSGLKMAFEIHMFLALFYLTMSRAPLDGDISK
ncbi:hypothetical protein DL98DRAFT_210454 [Cadophora sp. DSE1049]|nr:hypothetical protein DL98DRAFT_210454 [Cadophora sp. DSE1049]